MLRTKIEIRRDYLTLINKEKELGYSVKKIEELIIDPIEIPEIDKMIDDELYSTKTLRSQTVSTVRAYRIFCDIVVRRDIKTGDLIWNNFVKAQFEVIEFNKFSCYMAQRGGGKSFNIALFIDFKMYLLHAYDICYSTNVPKQRKRFLKTCESIIDKNELLLDKKDIKGVTAKNVSWGQEEMEYNGGTLEGTTVGTTPRGGHFNHIFVDDPLRDDKKYPYEYITNYIQGTLRPTMYRKKGRYTVVGTPQDPEDPFHTLMNEKLDKNNRPIGKIVVGKVSAAGFYSKIFPAILDNTNKIVLVPSIWSYDGLMEEKESIGEIRFNREMLCKCGSARNSLIGSALFRSCCDESLTLLQKGEEGKKYVIFVDSATSDAPTADYCAMSVWEDDMAHNKFILRHLVHKKGFPITDPTGGSDDQGHTLFKLYNDFNKALVVVEKNNAGIAVSQAAQALGIPEVIEHFTHVMSTGRPTERPGKANDVIDYIEKGLKTGVIVFPSNYEDIYTTDSLDRVKHEHLNFGVKQGRSGEKYEALAGHDDIMDTCVFAFKHRSGLIQTLPYAITVSG